MLRIDAKVLSAARPYPRLRWIKLWISRAHSAHRQASRRLRPIVRFLIDIKQLATVIDAQKAWIILWKSCIQIAAGPVKAEVYAAARDPYTHRSAPAYPPVADASKERRLGICTEAVDESVRSLFEECLRPGKPRPADARSKIEQDQ
ncbi:hypothetical protein ACSVIJ_19010 [Pseudomonas sp. NCHU5208]|uniref:hypothetical protein n=1 Tax=unclassified Pseudomonas TaxID=196821 RepID=UPI003F9C1FEF